MTNVAETRKQLQISVSVRSAQSLPAFPPVSISACCPEHRGMQNAGHAWRPRVGGRVLSAVPIRLPYHQRGTPPPRSWTMWPFNPLSVQRDLWKQEVSPFKEPASNTTCGCSVTTYCSQSVSSDGPYLSALTAPLAEHLRAGREMR